MEVNIIDEKEDLDEKLLKVLSKMKDIRIYSPPLSILSILDYIFLTYDSLINIGSTSTIGSTWAIGDTSTSH